MEDKIKEILLNFFNDYARACGHPKEVIEVENKYAKQITDLYEPPKELELTDEEIKRAAYKYNELYKGGRLEYTRKPNADRCIADEAIAKARLYYEPKGDGEGLLTDEAIEKELGIEMYLTYSGHWAEYKAIAKAQKLLDDIKIKELEKSNAEGEVSRASPSPPIRRR